MAAVVMAVAGDRKQFVAVACVNIVVAANAGGAFSPFGDITTLMVWQKGIVRFEEFFVRFLPSVVNWLIPAIFMSFVVPKDRPHASESDTQIKRGGFFVIALFLLTIACAVSMHHFFHLPPMLGMMTGLGLLKICGYVIRRRELSRFEIEGPEQADSDVDPGVLALQAAPAAFRYLYQHEAGRVGYPDVFLRGHSLCGWPRGAGLSGDGLRNVLHGSWRHHRKRAGRHRVCARR